MNTVEFAAILWLVLATIFGGYLFLIRMIDRAHRALADGDWGRRGPS